MTFDPHPRAVLGRDVELSRRSSGGSSCSTRRESTTSSCSPSTSARATRADGVRRAHPPRHGRRGRRGGGHLPLRARPPGRSHSSGAPRLRRPARAVLENVSSSRIRELAPGGEPERAARLLGRPPRSRASSSTATGGAASLAFRPRTSTSRRLAHSAGRRLRRLDARPAAAISVGTNPQFDGVERRVEAHLLDFDDDLYDQRLVVEVWGWIRGTDALRVGRRARRRRSATTSCRCARPRGRPSRSGGPHPADARDAGRGKSMRWLMSGPPAMP